MKRLFMVMLMTTAIAFASCKNEGKKVENTQDTIVVDTTVVKMNDTLVVLDSAKIANPFVITNSMNQAVKVASKVKK